MGTNHPASVVFIEDLFGITRGVKRIARLLKKTPALGQKEDRTLIAAKAADLLRVLGEHTGRGVLKPGNSKWTRMKRGGLDLGLVTSHLKGKRHVAPFHPKGAWPFVVIDIDRHNAVQEVNFTQTLMGLKKLFPRSCVIQSSQSTGVHLYVRLPPETAYADGALMLRAYLTLCGLRWHDAGNSPRPLRSEIVEVPDQPVRLPFGLGSFLLGSQQPLHEQLDEFIKFVRSSGHGDFDKACQIVDNKLKLKGRSALARRLTLLESLLEEEVRGLRPVKLDETDPWNKVIGKLPAPLKLIAASGIPAYGTRHRWTFALVQRLADLVPPDEVRSLMLYWLHNRDHVSEDIEVDLVAVEHQTATMIDSTYRKLGGIPEVKWKKIAAHVTTAYDMFTRSYRVGSPEHAMQVSALGRRVDADRYIVPRGVPKFSLEDALRTAFFIVRRFFELRRCVRSVPYREFGREAGKNNAELMRLVVVGKDGWLWQTEPPRPLINCRIYELRAGLWSSRPGPRLFCPPPPVIKK